MTARDATPDRPAASHSGDLALDVTPIGPAAPVSGDLARAFADSFRSSGPGPAAAPLTGRADAPDVLTVDQVARWLGVNRKTVYDAAARKQLPCARIGRRVLLSRAAVAAWLAGRPS